MKAPPGARVENWMLWLESAVFMRSQTATVFPASSMPTMALEESLPGFERSLGGSHPGAARAGAASSAQSRQARSAALPSEINPILFDPAEIVISRP